MALAPSPERQRLMYECQLNRPLLRLDHNDSSEIWWRNKPIPQYSYGSGLMPDRSSFLHYEPGAQACADIEALGADLGAGWVFDSLPA
jgi:hypothetical protein